MERQGKQVSNSGASDGIIQQRGESCRMVATNEASSFRDLVPRTRFITDAVTGEETGARSGETLPRKSRMDRLVQIQKMSDPFLAKEDRLWELLAPVITV